MAARKRQCGAALTRHCAGYHVLTLDMIGGMVAAYLMVLIDSYADEARVKATGERVHHRRFFFEEVCHALVAAVSVS